MIKNYPYWQINSLRLFFLFCAEADQENLTWYSGESLMEDNDISRNLIKNGFPIKLEIQNNKVYFSYILERELFKDYEWKF